MPSISPSTGENADTETPIHWYEVWNGTTYLKKTVSIKIEYTLKIQQQFHP